MFIDIELGKSKAFLCDCGFQVVGQRVWWREVGGRTVGTVGSGRFGVVTSGVLVFSVVGEEVLIDRAKESSIGDVRFRMIFLLRYRKQFEEGEFSGRRVSREVFWYRFVLEKQF